MGHPDQSVMLFAWPSACDLFEAQASPSTWSYRRAITSDPNFNQGSYYV